jgi:hypothetical protein
MRGSYKSTFRFPYSNLRMLRGDGLVSVWGRVLGHSNRWK